MVSDLQQFCGLRDRQAATDALEAAHWDLELAGDYILCAAANASAAAPTPPPVDLTKINAWFETYAEEDQPETMQVDGIVKFCQDLEVSPEDIVLVVISKYFGAANMLVYTKEEFVRGMQAMGVDTLDKLKQKIPDLRAELKDDELFKEIYFFAFGWACPPGQKSMQTETAVALWKLLLPERFELLDTWTKYIEQNRKHAISRDEWQLLLQFAKATDKDLNGYDENEAWPVLIDEFAEYVKNNTDSSAGTN
ncbi:Defective in cullin neddylation protein 1 [Hondaea fermentalgiana]|uniref:Defective in cullin neddylation protein n=1 Tax=Hondaea fermentalgiana TaxID=2315210 RepID=A0A2R5G9Z6_9STRA|nr:Defective in cullin neddylation protein 1 [Hondaea fermentalgiana]|eukprot:GBG26548.1 Defective in cullin neddylation protein 1 [Hondaea fermentalgiana]